MCNLRSILTSSSFFRKKSKQPNFASDYIMPQTQSLSGFSKTKNIQLQTIPNDVFIKPQPTVTYKTDKNGKPILQLVKTGNKSEVQTLDGQPLYTHIKNENGTNEIVYSFSGNKLYEKQIAPNGECTKTLFADDGKTINSIISFDKEGNVKSKEIINETSTEITDEAKENLPEYIYHFTSEENYKSMLESGEIKASYSDRYLRDNGNKAIFLVDSDNLLNHWDSLKNETRGSYLVRLLKFCDKSQSGKIVMLKIPTSKLDINNILFRNQNYVMDEFAMYDLPKKTREKFFACSKLIKEIHKDQETFMDNISCNIFMPEKMKHLKDGCSISKLQEHSSEPCEILYSTNIPSDLIESATVIDTSAIKNMPMYDEKAEQISKELVKKAL